MSWKMNFFCLGSERALPDADRDFGRERPGEHFWAAKPHKHRGRLPPKTRFSCTVFFQTTYHTSGSSAGLYLNALQNAKRMFRPEHCVCFCVLAVRCPKSSISSTPGFLF